MRILLLLAVLCLCGCRTVGPVVRVVDSPGATVTVTGCHATGDMPTSVPVRANAQGVPMP